jgi:hypothetical protein
VDRAVLDRLAMLVAHAHADLGVPIVLRLGAGDEVGHEPAGSLEQVMQDPDVVAPANRRVSFFGMLLESFHHPHVSRLVGTGQCISDQP